MTLTLVVAILLTGMAVFVSATGEAPELSIDYCNLSFRDSVCIKYAVASTSSEETTLLLWDEPSDEYLYGTHIAELETVGNQTISDETYKVFDYTDLAAKQMTDVVYARAYTVVDGKAYYSDVAKYSILQYAYSKLGKTGTASDDENLKAMLSSMLEYGANAQTYFEYSTDRLATYDFYQVKVEGGLIDDQCDHGLYLEGEEVNIFAPATNDEGVAFSHWKNGSGEVVANTAETTITVEAMNDIYTAVYVKTSADLEFDSNGDGTCCLVSIGECKDKDIIIPMASPDGDIVTSIDSSAFAGEEITSITIPATIEEIGRKAFNGCDSLTDVYYEGSKEEWEVLCDSIGSNNAPLLDANIHFAKVTTYTVTFVDHDGTVLDTQEIASGEAATAPEDPVRDGYTFAGWDKAFDVVTENMTVTALYEKDEVTYDGHTIVVESVTASAGDTVEIAVSIKNNPGILGTLVSVEFDESVLTLTDYENADAFSELTLQGPANKVSGCNFVWYGSEMENVIDGDILTLSFKVSESALSGEYGIVVNCDSESTYDLSYDHVVFNTVNGSVIVE